MIPFNIERYGIILEIIVWNSAKGLSPNLGKIKNKITTIINVNAIGIINFTRPFCLLDIMKFVTKYIIVKIRTKKIIIFNIQ